MVGVTEASTAGTPQHAALVAGDNQLDLGETITFTLYYKVILPLDGFVFWVRADLLSPSAILNTAEFNDVELDQPPELITPAPTIQAEGSFHISVDKRSNEDETIAINRVIFTAHEEVQAFNTIAPNQMYIGSFPFVGGVERFAFKAQAPYYEVSDLYHYTGDAIYPALESQIIDGTDLDMSSLVVSNSLPIWLSIPNFQAVWWNPQWNFPLYPSFVVPDNVRPPYATVHILPDQTQAIEAVPYLDSTYSDSQLARDLVRITLYGIRNTDARSFLVSILDYMRNSDAIGLMGNVLPIVKDEKRTQAELSMIAMKKTLDLEVSYLQGASRNIARQLIKEAIPTVIIDPFSL